jgi:hypothetical protein
MVLNSVLLKLIYPMKEKDNNKKLPGRKAGNEEKNDLQGYPLYAASEDVYNKYKGE